MRKYWKQVKYFKFTFQTNWREEARLNVSLDEVFIEIQYKTIIACLVV